MKYLTKLQELKKEDVKTGGGKASNLGELLKGGFRVPGGFCVNSDGFWQFMKYNNIINEIDRVVNAVVKIKCDTRQISQILQQCK